MELDDYQDKLFFTPFELEYLLQIPLSDVVELFQKVPKVSEPRGCYEGSQSRELLAKWSRKRVYADIIARNAVNAVPVLRRAEDQGRPHEISLLNETNGETFVVRFPGDLKRYLEAHFRETEPSSEGE